MLHSRFSGKKREHDFLIHGVMKDAYGWQIVINDPLNKFEFLHAWKNGCSQPY